MASKIIPVFSGPLTANGLKLWLGQCEDGFDNYQDTHKDSTLSVKTRIRLTGSAMQETSMAEWWSLGRKEYLDLGTWEAFVVKLKARFLPPGWKMDALEKFFACEQGRRDFQSYAAELAQAYGALPSDTLSATVYKYHILFHSHPQLYLRIRALPNFDVDSTAVTVDTLTSLMGHQWDSLIADASPRGARAAGQSALKTTAVVSPSLTTAATTSGPTPPPLSEADRKALQDANGCFNCRRKPGDAEWTPHFRRNCPGNAEIGAGPGAEYQAPTKVMAAAAFSSFPRDADTSEEEEEEDWDGESDDDPLS